MRLLCRGPKSVCGPALTLAAWKGAKRCLLCALPHRPERGHVADLAITDKDEWNVIALANDIESAGLADPGRMRGPLPGPPEPPAGAARPYLHFDLAIARNAFRRSQLREANRRLVTLAASAQARRVEAEQAQHRQTEFLAVVAHELRNPLAPIRSAAALLGRGRCDDDTQARLKTIIERQVVHLTRLVEDLLDLSRIETGKLRLECEVLDLREIVDAAVQDRQPEALARGQRLDAIVCPQPLAVRGDPVRLAQVLGNLLDNACKYTPDGGSIELVASVAGDVVLVTVSDSGIGITAEVLPHVFETFVQDLPADGVSRKGLGLGLAVVNGLVEAHGGSVVAHSAGRGLGTRVVVTFPLASAVRSSNS